MEVLLFSDIHALIACSFIVPSDLSKRVSIEFFDSVFFFVEWWAVFDSVEY